MTERWTIGADVGGTAVKYVVCDETGGRRLLGDVPTDPHDADATLGELAAVLTDELGDDRDRVAAVGLACAGIVDPVAGTLARAPNLKGWENSHLGDLMAKHFPGRRFVLANDVNAALVGERSHGAGRGCRDVVMLALGTGVGGAVIVDGRLLTGTHFGAGEIGHMILDPKGPACGCGNAGCLEAYAGAKALGAEARRRAARSDADRKLAGLCRDGRVPTPRELVALAEAGHAEATSILTDAGRMLGVAVGNVLNVLDPDRVIIGGGVAQAGDLIFEPCRRAAAEVVLCEAAEATPIVPAELGPVAAAMGAQTLAAGGAPP